MTLEKDGFQMNRGLIQRGLPEVSGCETRYSVFVFSGI